MASQDSEPQAAALRQAFADTELITALLEELDAGVYLVDRERRIHYWSPGAARITGYMAHDMAGRLCHDDLLMHCDSEGNALCAADCHLAGVLADGKSRDCEVFVRHRQGHRVPVRVRCHAVHDAGGQVAGALEVFERLLAPARQEIAALEVHGCLDELT